MSSYPKELFFLILLSLVIITSLSDFVGDIGQGSSSVHLTVEGLIIAFSIAATIYLIDNIRTQDRELAQLKQQLVISRQQLLDASESFSEGRTQYSQLIRDQFRAWKLTDSEQEIAMLLLKGLSFKEIAAIRTTREKTVRQQAASIYAKSGHAGRHELVAHFIEDLMSHDSG